jgi:predicted dehydrogenase
MYDDWRMDAGRKGQSVIFGHGCHTYDLILFLLGDDPVEHATFVNKTGFKEYPQAYTAATTVLRFGNGAIAKSHVNNCCVFPQLNNLIVLGEKGSYIDGELYKGGRFERVADFFPRRDYLREPPRSFVRPVLNVLRHPEHLLSVAARRTQRALQKYFSRKGLWRQPPLTVYNHELACERVVDNFIAAVTEGEPVLVGYEEALRVIRLCEELEKDATARSGVMGFRSA